LLGQGRGARRRPGVWVGACREMVVQPLDLGHSRLSATDVKVSPGCTTSKRCAVTYVRSPRSWVLRPCSCRTRTARQVRGGWSRVGGWVRPARSDLGEEVTREVSVLHHKVRQCCAMCNRR